jgi:hypothetical protein
MKLTVTLITRDYELFIAQTLESSMAPRVNS